MSIWSWLSGTRERKNSVNSGHAQANQCAPKTSDFGNEDAVTYALNLSGLVIDQPEPKAFYQALFADHPDQFVSYLDLRKKGNLLTKETLKALGLRSNIKLSSQFFGTLNETGKTDPIKAAQVIAAAISTTLCSLRDVKSMQAAGIESAIFHASNMAAGPCSCAAKLDGQELAVANFQILPIKGCSHPGQCACRYRAELKL